MLARAGTMVLRRENAQQVYALFFVQEADRVVMPVWVGPDNHFLCADHALEVATQ